jgi:circadian clock protein KaiB
MKTPIRPKRRNIRPRRDARVFRLFVAGTEPNSAQARENLVRLCEAHVPGRYAIDTVDVLKHAEAAYRAGVVVTPTVFRLKPLPKVTVFGNLGDTRQVLAALRLAGGR